MRARLKGCLSEVMMRRGENRNAAARSYPYNRHQERKNSETYEFSHDVRSALRRDADPRVGTCTVAEG